MLLWDEKRKGSKLRREGTRTGPTKPSQISCVGPLYWETKVDYDNCEDFGLDDEVLTEKWVEEAGGSSLNFARTCRSFGLEPILVAPVGLDLVGKLIESDLATKGIQFRPIRLEGTSGRSFIIKKTGHSTYISYPGVNLDLKVGHILKAWTRINNGALVYLSGVPKLGSALEKLPNLVNLVHKLNGLVALDHGRLPRRTESKIVPLLRRLAKLCDFYFPNENEILRVTSSKSINGALNRAKYLFPDTIVIVKQGEKGCTAIHNGKCRYFKTTPILEPRDTVGAGDTFNAAFVWSFCFMNQVLSKACNFANYVAYARIMSMFDWDEQWNYRSHVSGRADD
jgi:hypothetical protein